MNIFEHIADLGDLKERVKGNQDAILDIFEKGNADHIRIMKETCELIADAERLEEEYYKLMVQDLKSKLHGDNNDNS